MHDVTPEGHVLDAQHTPASGNMPALQGVAFGVVLPAMQSHPAEPVVVHMMPVPLPPLLEPEPLPLELPDPDPLLDPELLPLSPELSAPPLSPEPLPLSTPPLEAEPLLVDDPPELPPLPLLLPDAPVSRPLSGASASGPPSLESLGPILCDEEQATTSVLVASHTKSRALIL